MTLDEFIASFSPVANVHAVDADAPDAPGMVSGSYWVDKDSRGRWHTIVTTREYASTDFRVCARALWEFAYSADERLQPMEALTSAEFFAVIRLDVRWVDRTGNGRVNQFVITCIGRVLYAVDIASGEALTRPQLIERYARIASHARWVTP